MPALTESDMGAYDFFGKFYHDWLLGESTAWRSCQPLTVSHMGGSNFSINYIMTDWWRI